jgi:hypothetical protein
VPSPRESIVLLMKSGRLRSKPRSSPTRHKIPRPPVASSTISPDVYHLINSAVSFHFLYLLSPGLFDGRRERHSPRDPPLQKSCWTGTRYQLRSAQRQINSPQLSSFVSKDRRPLLLSGAGRVGALIGDVWILSWGSLRREEVNASCAPSSGVKMHNLCIRSE